MGIDYTVVYNRWSPMRSVFDRLIRPLDEKTIVPYKDVIIECKDNLYRMEREIDVKMPQAVKNIMDNN